MTAKADTESSSALDTVKLLAAAAIVVGGVVFYYVYAELPIVVRALGVLGGLVLGIVVALQSSQGKTLWQFVQGSRVELRKVVWPTRQEAVQTTIAVLVFALIMGVFFWLLDLFLLWATRTLTGQGGI